MQNSPVSARKITELAEEVLNNAGINPVGTQLTAFSVTPQAANFTAEAGYIYLVSEVDANTPVVVTAPSNPQVGDQVGIYGFPTAQQRVDITDFASAHYVTTGVLYILEYFGAVAGWAVIGVSDGLNRGRSLAVYDMTDQQANFTARVGYMYEVDSLGGLDVASVVVTAPQNPINGDEVTIRCLSGHSQAADVSSFTPNGSTVAPGDTVTFKYLTNTWQVVSKFTN